MSDLENNEVKTLSEYLRDVTAQLKEMLHYGQSNSEILSAQWLAFDEGDYKHKELADKITLLLNKQGELIEAIETAANDVEIEANRIDNEA